MCAQLQPSLVVLHPVSRGPESAPIIDQLCARPATRRQVSWGSATAADQDCATFLKSAAIMPTAWRTKARGSAHAETEFQGVSYGLAMG